MPALCRCWKPPAFTSAFIPGIKPGELYKFAITTQTGKVIFKADPFAQYAEYRPGTASITAFNDNVPLDGCAPGYRNVKTPTRARQP